MTTTTVALVIYESPNGRDNWVPIPPELVPEWLKDPDCIAELARGEMCMDPTQGDKGSNWYRAERVTVPPFIQ